jgi:rfaE bifunctional protein kinase chain/domain
LKKKINNKLNSRIPLFDYFSKVKILVVGDVMLDKYLCGEVDRISPEAPVPVVRLTDTNLVAGGAANVAANIAGLGATAFLVGITGSDDEGDLFPKVLDNSGISGKYLVKSDERPTTVKTRIIAHNQQIARIDQESINILSEVEEENVWLKIDKLLKSVDVVLLSDYNKGILTENLTSRLIRKANELGKPVLVDPKGKSYSKYMNATIITPNKSEVAEVCELEGDIEKQLDEAGQNLLTSLKLNALLITRGENGMTLMQRDGETVDFKTVAREVFDVTGAGDTVIAALAVALLVLTTAFLFVLTFVFAVVVTTGVDFPQNIKPRILSKTSRTSGSSHLRIESSLSSKRSSALFKLPVNLSPSAPAVPLTESMPLPTVLLVASTVLPTVASALSGMPPVIAAAVPSTPEVAPIPAK